ALMGMGPATESEAAILANASFEGDSLATGAPGVLSDADGNYTLSAPADWTLTGGTGGVFAPAASIVDPAGLTGSNVAWLRQNATLAQDTGLTLEEGAIYRLSLDLGDRSSMPWPSGEARLMSGTTVLATLALDAPGDGEWSSVSLETGAID